jgi:hypothetical protein
VYIFTGFRVMETIMILINLITIIVWSQWLYRRKPGQNEPVGGSILYGKRRRWLCMMTQGYASACHDCMTQRRKR